MRMRILAVGALLLAGCAGAGRVADNQPLHATGAASRSDGGTTVQAADDPAARWDAEERAQRMRFLSPLSAF